MLYMNNGESEVVALHKGYNPRINLNVGTKVTQELIGQVKAWGREMKAGFRVQRTMTIDEQMDEKSKDTSTGSSMRKKIWPKSMQPKWARSNTNLK